MSEQETTKRSLFTEFLPVSAEEWEKVISKDLRGADYKEKLRWDTAEGFTALPFYRREDLAGIPRKASINPKTKQNTWDICESIYKTDIAAANNAARNALDRGATALQFSLEIRRAEGMLGGDVSGLPIQNQKDFSDLLHDIPLERVPLYFDSGMASPALLTMLANDVKSRKLNAQNVSAFFLFDPYSFALFNGQFHKTDYESVQQDIIRLTAFANNILPQARPLGIDARSYHNAGSTIVQELAYALATASEYFAILTEAGFDVNEVSRLIHFNFGIGSKYFPEIAKFRAARLLWKNLIEAFGGDFDANNCFIHGETSRWNKTLYDPYTNMLRTTTEGMSAAIAGCDSIAVLPFDEHFHHPNDFSERIARNSQLILSDEAYLDKVTDPAAGSYYVENLTEEIGRKAWALFQEIEQEGGLMQAIQNGTPQATIQETQEERDRAIATRGRIFVGTNQYSKPNDTMGDEVSLNTKTTSLNKSGNEIVIDSQNFPESLGQAFSDGANIADVISSLFDYGKHHFRTISQYRGPQAFEELRLATEHSDHTPKVLTLPLGNRRMRKARSAYTANFFGCAGYDIEDPIGYESVDEAVAAVKKQEPDVAVLCSSDKEYKKLVPEICRGLQNLEIRPILVLAGYPKEDVESFKTCGIDEFIYAGSNVLETLQRFQQKLNIT